MSHLLMWLQILFIATGFVRHTEGAGKFCGSVSLFDALCTKNGTVFFLSSKPCYSKRFVTLTILRTGLNPFFHLNSTESSIDQPIRIGKTSTGVLLDVSEDVYGSYHESYLPTVIYTVQLHENGTMVPDTKEKVLSFAFLVAPLTCEKYKMGDGPPEKGQPLRSPPPYCDKSRKHGDFSSLCYKKDRGVFVIVLDICKMPYTTHVFILEPQNDLEIIRQFTATMNTPVPIKASGVLGGERGVKLMMRSYGKAHEKQHIKLTQIFENDSQRPDILIDDLFVTTFGMMCPPKLFRTTKEDYNKIMLSSNGKEVHSNTFIQLDACSENTIKATIEVKIDGYPNRYIQKLIGSHFFFSNVTRYNFSLGGPNYSFSKIQQMGYLPLDGGQLSMRVDEDKTKNEIRVMLYRHFPTFYDAFPILNGVFLDVSKSCAGSGKSSKATMKIVVPILCVILVLLLIVVFLYWRRQRRNDDVGLLYQIELNDEDGVEDDDDFNERS